jgi:toxin ParE1/3/4
MRHGAASFTAAAKEDVREAVRWIRRDNRGAARAFREAIRDAAARIGQHPNSGSNRPDIAAPPARVLVLTGFPYVLIYDCDVVPPRILRVLHGARDLPTVMSG